MKNQFLVRFGIIAILFVLFLCWFTFFGNSSGALGIAMLSIFFGVIMVVNLMIYLFRESFLSFRKHNNKSGYVNLLIGLSLLIVILLGFNVVFDVF